MSSVVDKRYGLRPHVADRAAIKIQSVIRMFLARKRRPPVSSCVRLLTCPVLITFLERRRARFLV